MGNGAAPYKTVLCKWFKENGTCDRGDACTFAHGMDDISGFNTKGGGAAPPDSKSGSDRSTPYKTLLCKWFKENGTCERGDACAFAHGAGEITGFKTKECKFFAESGTCTRGELCSFAHGAHELSKKGT